MIHRLRPYWLHAYLMVFTGFGLFAASRVATIWQEDLLSVLSFTVLFLASLKAPPRLRAQVWICVCVATGYEIFGSQIWGVYHYRFHNLPLYVPAGHGTVYLFGLLAAQTPLIQQLGRRVAYAVLAAATVWGLLALTVLPIFTGRTDLLGVACLPVLAWFLLRSPRWPVFAAIFVIVAELEICGTSFGNWYWMPVAPWTHIPAGNPPSVIAGAYCVIDSTVLVLIWLARTYGPGLNTIITRIRATMSAKARPMILLRLIMPANSEELV